MTRKGSSLSLAIGLAVLCFAVMVQSSGCQSPTGDGGEPPQSETFLVTVTPPGEVTPGTLRELWGAEISDPLAMGLEPGRPWYCVDPGSGTTVIWERPLQGYGELIRVEASAAVSQTGITGGLPLALSVTAKGLAAVVCRDLDANVANHEITAEWVDSQGETVWRVKYAGIDTTTIAMPPSLSLSPDGSALLVSMSVPRVEGQIVPDLKATIMRVEAGGEVSVTRTLPSAARMAVDWKGGKALLTYWAEGETKVELVDTGTLAVLASTSLGASRLVQVTLARSPESEVLWWLGGLDGSDLLAADLRPLWSVRGLKCGLSAAPTGWAVAWTASDCALITPAGEVAWSRPCKACLAAATASDGSLTVMVAGSEDGSPQATVDIVSVKGEVVSLRYVELQLFAGRPVAAAPAPGRVFAAWAPRQAVFGDVTAGGLTETELTAPRDFDRGSVSGQGRYVLLVSRDEATLGFYDLEAVAGAAGG